MQSPTTRHRKVAVGFWTSTWLRSIISSMKSSAGDGKPAWTDWPTSGTFSSTSVDKGTGMPPGLMTIREMRIPTPGEISQGSVIGTNESRTEVTTAEYGL